MGKRLRFFFTMFSTSEARKTRLGEVVCITPSYFLLKPSEHSQMLDYHTMNIFDEPSESLPHSSLIVPLHHKESSKLSFISYPPTTTSSYPTPTPLPIMHTSINPTIHEPLTIFQYSWDTAVERATAPFSYACCLTP